MEPLADAFQARIEEVIAGIAKSFPDWPPPKDVVDPTSNPLDRNRIEGALNGQRWTEINLTQWFEYAGNRHLGKEGYLVPDDLYELSAKGFAYYLPAFLTAIFRIKDPDIFLNFLTGRLGSGTTRADVFIREVIPLLSGDPKWVVEALHLLELKYPDSGAAGAAALWRELLLIK